MTHTVQLHAAAGVEVEFAADWYGDRGDELRVAWVQEVHRVFQRAAATPLAFARSAEHTAVRCAPTRRFPYTVFFTESQTGIVVLAVAHAKRRPGYWLGRAGAEDVRTG